MMKRKNGIKKEIISIWSKVSKNKDSMSKEEINKCISIYLVCIHLILLDRKCKTKHFEYFKLLFLSRDQNLKNIQLSLLKGICQDTVSDYIKSYIEAYVYVVEIINGCTISENFINNLREIYRKVKSEKEADL